ncbi:MAG: hypothetical protein P4L99_04790 [Chthoniobacter sp.]|nr:hypothetical protein [Chthoniobacter sp.]
MARPPNPYKKLGGRGIRRVAFGVTATRCQLWLAEDHLLAVDATLASEEYRRFYYRDIEAFIIRRTVGRMIWNWVLGILTLVTVVPIAAFYFSDRSVGALVAVLGTAAFWLVLILVNNLRGATCQTHIRTAAQVEQLPSLARIPATRKALARLRPLIVAAQGEATPEELVASPWMASEHSR